MTFLETETHHQNSPLNSGDLTSVTRGFRVNLHRVLLVVRTMDFRLKGPKGQATLRGVPADRPLNEFLQDRLGGIGEKTHPDMFWTCFFIE